jgi:hypothetical protein
MQALTLDDLLPLDEFAARRRELLAALQRYLDRHRRVRLGPQVTLLFENRQTLWFRVQDVLRIARLMEPARIEQELAVYNRLLPGRNRLQAALVIAVPDEARLSEELDRWESLRGEDLVLRLGSRQLPADLVTCRPEDRCIGAAHWVQFAVDADARQVLGDFRQPAHFEVRHASYRHASGPLNEDVRQSLLDDLELSDKTPQA